MLILSSGDCLSLLLVLGLCTTGLAAKLGLSTHGCMQGSSTSRCRGEGAVLVHGACPWGHGQRFSPKCWTRWVSTCRPWVSACFTFFLNGQTHCPRSVARGTRSQHAASASTKTWFGHYQLADFHFYVWEYVCIIKSCLLLRSLNQKDFLDPSCG